MSRTIYVNNVYIYTSINNLKYSCFFYKTIMSFQIMTPKSYHHKLQLKVQLI